MYALIPIDEPSYLANWLDGYRGNDVKAVGGLINFWAENQQFDIIHIQWPELLLSTGVKTIGDVEKIVACIKRWRERGTKVIGAVNNLFPHKSQNHELHRNLYEKVYGECDLLQHFSNASLLAFNDRYPSLAANPSVVTKPAGYSHLLSLQQDVDQFSRTFSSFSIPSDKKIVLVLGALRSWQEWSLVRRAFSTSKQGSKTLVITSRFVPGGNFVLRNIQKAIFRLWLRFGGACALPEPVPDRDIPALMRNTSVVLVPRIDDISSALPGLAMTFGTPVAVPNHGAFPEYVFGTENPLYESGSFTSLSGAIDSILSRDKSHGGQWITSRQGIAQREWSDIVQECLRLLRS